jgi:branched-chain amino acid transport system permease protein
MIQALIGGLTSGSIYALLGLGIVLTFTVSRFVNLAQGEFYVYGGLLATTLVGTGLPVALSMTLSVVAVSILAAALDVAVFAPLSRSPEPTQLLGGIAVAIVMSGVAQLAWGTGPRSLPELWSHAPVAFWHARVTLQSLTLFAVLALLCVGLWLLLSRTMLGLSMHAVAALGRTAGVVAINVRSVRTAAFAGSGAVGAIAGVVVTPLVFVDYQSGLQLTVYGFIAAAFGGLRSIRGAVLGGLALGVFEAMIAYYWSSSLKTPLAIALLVLVLLSRSAARGSLRTAVAALRVRARTHLPRALPTPPRSSLLERVVPRRGNVVGIVVVLVCAFVGPSVLPPYWVSLMSFAGVFVIVGIGLDLLLGFTGQLSLGQTTFTGVAAYLVALSFKWWDVSAWTAALFSIAATALIALLLGLIVLRLSGYYFTLATLAVAIAAEALVNALPDKLGGPSGLPVTKALSVGSLSFDTSDRLFTLTWVLVAAALWVSLRLVRSRFGKAMQAVGHDLELAGAVGVSAFGVKLKAFVISSIFAAVAGVLFAQTSLYVTPPIVGFNGGFDAVVGVLLGGFGTIWGAVIGIPTVRALPEISSSFQDYELLVYGLIILAFVMLLPEGIFGGLRSFGSRLARRRQPQAVIPPPRSEPGGAVASTTAPPASRPDEAVELPILLAEGIDKRFGGVHAVRGVDLAVRRGSVVGLIGPNGAGKSTCLSLLAGSLPTDRGTITVSGTEVTNLPVDARVAMGIARTFQLPRLPADMSVLDVATLGTFRRGSSGLVRGLVGPVLHEERSMRQAGLDALALVGLESMASAAVSALSTGQQKMLELARALASCPSILLADEPAGGLDEEEVDALATTIRQLARNGIAVLLVEHEMRLVMGTCDEIVVLQDGGVIGSGTPSEIRRNEEVLNAYLGT